MVSVKARDDIHTQVTRSVEKGARLLLGGKIPDRPGAWYPVTVLADVRTGQPAHDDEVFGPVAAIIAAEDEADAIRMRTTASLASARVCLLQISTVVVESRRKSSKPA